MPKINYNHRFIVIIQLDTLLWQIKIMKFIKHKLIRDNFLLRMLIKGISRVLGIKEYKTKIKIRKVILY